jgi:hypothetical protein
MEKMKRNLSLYLGLAIPVVMIILVVSSVYLPGLFIKPQYSFLYATSNSYANDHYIVSGEKLVDNKSYEDKNIAANVILPETRLFFYDIEKNESREISFEEAEAFVLDSSNESPDGFEVENGRRGGGLFFSGYNDYSEKFLVSGLTSKKLNIDLDRNYSYKSSYYFRFLGWIK